MRPGRVALGTSIALVAVGLLAAAEVTQPAARTATPAAGLTAQVEATTLVCAAAVHNTSITGTRTTVASGRGGEGTVTVETLDRTTGATPVALSDDKPSAEIALDVEKPLVVRATGPVSTGITALRTTRSGDPASRGLEADRCVSPRTQWWFTGVSTGAGVTSVLHLANAEDTEAGVTVTGLSDKGRVDSPVTRGLLLPAHSGRDLPLDLLAPGVDGLAVQVLATRGRVAASVSEVRPPTPKPQGVDIVPAQGSPAASLYIPGVPGGSAGSVIAGAPLHKVLYVGVPGATDATVHVEVTDDNARYLPVGADALTVNAGTVVAVNLDQALGGAPVVLRVYADDYVPIVAGVFVDAGARFGDYHESVHLGPASPFTGGAVVGDLRAGPDRDSRLVITAYARGATGFTLTVPGLAPRHVDLPASRTIVLRASELNPAAGITPFSAVLVPDKGATNLYAGVLLEELGFNGPLLGGYSVSGGLGPVVLPRASPDLRLPLIDARAGS